MIKHKYIICLVALLIFGGASCSRPVIPETDGVQQENPVPDGDGDKEEPEPTPEPEPEPEPTPEPTPEPEPEPEPNKDYPDIVFLKGIPGPHKGDLENSANDQYLWYESSETRWFDVKKRGGDSEFCWVATAAGMLHHWYQMNDGRIQEYLKTTTKDIALYNHSYIYDYDLNAVQNGNQSITSDPKSGIFSVFKSRIRNSAGAIRNAMNWYLFDKDLPGVKALALFDGMFGGDNSIILSRLDPDKETFEAMVIEAARAGHPVGIEYSYTRKRGQHAVNVWGYTKNADGSIRELWITDSNTGPASGNIPMHNYGVIFKDGKVQLSNLSSTRYPDEAGIFAEVIELVVLKGF
ncbi:MAG: IdeS/Mac family cysteine endopeptidase [Candidatus Cryptobacteroides sp.]